MRKVDMSLGQALFVLAIIAACIGGWIANIVKIVGTDFTPITTMLIVRFIGIFVAPLGSILGFL